MANKIPSLELLRQWAADKAQDQCWGLDAVADEIERLLVNADRYLWLNADGDRCAQVVSDAYSDWDTDVHWEEHFDAAVTEAMRRASDFEIAMDHARAQHSSNE